ncbi:MAG: cytidylyltransferase domain-containing protein [Cyclobacteriaceae bacterium]
MRIGCIILARYNSSRLPGKALIMFDDKPLLRHVYDALDSVFTSDNIVVATSNESSDDTIADYCQREQINYYRGSLQNVADRFISAAQENSFDYAMRINGDNLFVELTTVRKMILDAQKSQDFYSNVPGRTFPFGMSVEMVKTSFYEQVLKAINESANYQEHVTLYLYDHSKMGNRKYYVNDEYPEASGVHLSIDTPQDSKIAQRMLKRLSKPIYENELSTIVKTYHLCQHHE